MLADMNRLLIAGCSSLAVVAWLTLGGTARAQTGTFLDKWDAEDVRVVTYNVYWDSIFEDTSTSALPDRFARVINALQPDVLALQEIRESAAATAAMLDTLAPLPGGAGWNAFKFSDNVILSPYPFLLTTSDVGHADVLVDLPDGQYERDLFLTSDHWPCCSNESGRQEDADRLVRWLDDVRTPGGQVDVPEGTPLVVVGDLNTVGSGRPLEALRTGDILDNGRWGADSPPDWDGTPLTNASPLHNGTGPDTYTWRNDRSSFAPGVLDHILYTDSVMEPANGFVLEPATMTPAELAATGLEPFDVQLNEVTGWYDHLPVIADFRLPAPALPGDYNQDGSVNAADYTAWTQQLGMTGDQPADGNGDGRVDAADYTVWRDALEAGSTAQTVPEPGGLALVLLVGSVFMARRR